MKPPKPVIYPIRLKAFIQELQEFYENNGDVQVFAHIKITGEIKESKDIPVTLDDINMDTHQQILLINVPVKINVTIEYSEPEVDLRLE